MITYDEILQSMKNAYKEKTGYDVSEQSDIGIRMRVLSGELFKSAVNVEWLKNQMFPQTAQGEYLDMHAQLRSIERKPAVKAQGYVMFGINEAAESNITIPSGTVVSTADSPPVLFETLYDAVIISGRLTAGADVVCLDSGVKGNVKAGTVTIMTTPPTGVDYVTNDEDFEGGADEESDIKLRQRIIDSFNNVPNGINSAFYIDRAMMTDGVYSAGVIGCNRGLGTVDVFLSGQGTGVTEDIVKTVQADFDVQKDINTDVLVKSASGKPFTVSLNLWVKSGYVFASVKQKVLNAMRDYVNSLGVGKSVYLVDLGEVIYHVEGVERYEFISAYSSDSQIAQNTYAFFKNADVYEGD